MTAMGLCERRLPFQPSFEYSPLVAPLECFITGQIPAAGATPSSHIHIQYEEPSYRACEEYESQLDAIGEVCDCMSSVGGYKHGRTSRRAPIIAVSE